MKKGRFLLVATLFLSFLTIMITMPQLGICESMLWDKVVSKQAPDSIKIGGAVSATGMFGPRFACKNWI